MKELVNMNWDVIGAKLAALSDNEQALFFTGFAKELDHYDTHFQKETQMLYIKDKLTEKTKKTLEEYFPSLWFKDNE